MLPAFSSALTPFFVLTRQCTGYVVTMILYFFGSFMPFGVKNLRCRSGTWMNPALWLFFDR